MSRVRIVYKPDGQVEEIYPVMKAKLNTETLDEFCERVFIKHMAVNGLEGLEFEDMDTSKLPAITEAAPRDKWRKNPGGPGIIIDGSVVLPSEVRAADRALLRAEKNKPAPNIKTVVDLLLKLHENEY